MLELTFFTLGKIWHTKKFKPNRVDVQILRIKWVFTTCNIS